MLAHKGTQAMNMLQEKLTSQRKVREGFLEKVLFQQGLKGKVILN